MAFNETLVLWFRDITTSVQNKNLNQQTEHANMKKMCFSLFSQLALLFTTHYKMKNSIQEYTLKTCTFECNSMFMSYGSLDTPD